MTDSTGAVKWSADYKPFGEATVDPTSTITNNLRFPGQYYDQETGLHYNYMRDYNPSIGKYIQSDPIGIMRGTNHLYAYVYNNPLIFVDIMGLGCQLISTSIDKWQDQKETMFYGDWIYTGYSRINTLCWCNFHRAKRIDVDITDYTRTKLTFSCTYKDKCGKEHNYDFSSSSISELHTEFSKSGGTDYKEEAGSMFATPGKEKGGGGCSCQPVFPPPPGIYSK